MTTIASPSKSTKKTTQRAPRRGRPVGNHEEKRVELLNAAIAVIAEEGYGGASMRKIAKRANCTTGALTYYFANKEEVVAAVTETLFDFFNSSLNLQRDEPDIGPFFRRWLQWIDDEESGHWHALFQLIAHARQEPSFANVFEKCYSDYRKKAAAVLRKGQEKGTIRNDISAELLADHLCAIGDGWMIGFPIEPNRFKPRRLKSLTDSIALLLAPVDK